MGYEAGETYAFTFQGVEEMAPAVSGVYTIYTAQRWVYVGESGDIQQAMFRHLNESDPCMEAFDALSFSFERASEVERRSRHDALVAELKPACCPAKR